MKKFTSDWALTSNLFLSKNEVEIIDHLVDHQEMPLNLEEDRVISFYQDNDFHLVLYFSQQQDRGFHMYVVKDFSANTGDLILLHELFGKLITDNLSIHMLSKAQNKIDNVIYMTNTFRAMIHSDEPHFFE
jgi:hypothetical protein